MSLIQVYVPKSSPSSRPSPSIDKLLKLAEVAGKALDVIPQKVRVLWHQMDDNAFLNHISATSAESPIIMIACKSREVEKIETLLACMANFFCEELRCQKEDLLIIVLPFLPSHMFTRGRIWKEP